jgi:serine/threonine protein kinase
MPSVDTAQPDNSASPPFPFPCTRNHQSSDDSIDAEVVAELKELMNEVFLLGSLSHPNIMRFCAVCLDPPMIVTQYYQHGSLFELLKKARRGDRRAAAELTWSKRLDMLRDVAAGMVFLHSRRPAVVHGDLRSPNLLLDMAFDRWDVCEVGTKYP